MYKPAVPLWTLCPATAALNLVVYQTVTEGFEEGSLVMLKAFPQLYLSAVRWIQWPGTKMRAKKCKITVKYKKKKMKVLIHNIARISLSLPLALLQMERWPPEASDIPAGIMKSEHQDW